MAPSPTGDPHVGTAYQALFDKAVAEATGGQFILRIEDTDRARSTRESEIMIFRALRWLGLTWDEGPDVGGPHGPYRQSERTEIYREHAALLLERGGAYRCFCTPERLEVLRAAQSAAKQPPRYDRTCSALPPADSAARALAEPHVLRLRVPSEGRTVVRDELRGEIAFENELIDDQVLVKSDGFPTYHLANVVDDHLMLVTDVIRGEEWLPSTPKHVLLYDAFGWTPPRFHHTPLLRNPDRSKFSKRKNPTSLDWYREQGYLPEAIVNFLGTLGWSHPEGKDFFDYAEFVRLFDWSRVNLAGPIFDMDKLLHLNGLWLRSLSREALKERLVAGGFTQHAAADPRLFDAALELVHERLTRLAEFDELAAFFFARPETPGAEQLVPPKCEAPRVRAALDLVAGALAAVLPWEKDAVEAGVRGVAAESGLKAKDVFMAVRVASTGRAVSTPLFETLVALGREESLARLRAAAARLA